MSIKIKTNIPFDINRCIENDMKSFGFVKNDGNINKNKFINHLLKNYYLTFSNKETTVSKDINKFLSSQNIKNITDEMISKIMSLVKEPIYDNKYYYNYSIQFIINKDNEAIFNSIEKYYLRNRSLSEYFREMLISYASNRQDHRELLLFPKLISKIESAINNKKRVILTFENNSSIMMDPFSIEQTKEELYNYLIGVQITNNGARRIISTKIYKIKEVIVTDDDIKINDTEKELFLKTIEHGAQFPISEYVITTLQLTKKGEQLYDAAYLNRPKYLKKENNVYYFDCAINQIDFYFFKFGEDVKIISPENLKNRFSNKYYLALNNYKKKHNNDK